MGDSRIKDITSLLSSFFNEDKLRRGEAYSAFFASWPDLVGPRFAAHSRVADVDKGLLVVEAEHPGWIQLLQLRQSSILEDVSRRFPELALRGIVFRLAGRPSAEAPRTEPENEAVEPAIDAAGDATEEDMAAQGIAEIKDPEFRALFSSLKKAMRGKG